MARILVERQLVMASQNKNKIQEITELLSKFEIDITFTALSELEENGVTFTDNAKLKALATAETVGLPALADDSGLAVTALGGAPGLYSARWAREEQSFAAAIMRIHTLLGETQDRSAHFVCALALAWPDGYTETFEGVVQGRIVWPPRGTKGFGYDPIFQPSGHTTTFAEMDRAVKQTISHRKRAFDKLSAACLKAPS